MAKELKMLRVLVFCMVISVCSSHSYKWRQKRGHSEGLIRIKPFRQKLFVESSLSIDFKNSNMAEASPLSQFSLFDNKNICENLFKHFSSPNFLSIYIAEGRSSEIIKVQHCDRKGFKGFVEINQELYSALLPSVQAGLLESLLKEFEFDDWKIEIGSFCMKWMTMDLSSQKCIKSDVLQKEIEGRLSYDNNNEFCEKGLNTATRNCESNHKKVHRRLDLNTNYDDYKAQYPLENALGVYSVVSEADTNLLKQMFSDLQTVKESYTNTSTFGAVEFDFVTGIILNLMYTNHFQNLTADLMNSLYGFSWSVRNDLLEDPETSTIQYIVDQSSLYLSYFNLSSSAFTTVESKLSSFYSFYSDQVLYIDQDPLLANASDYLTTQLSVYKVKLSGNELMSYSFSLNSTNISFSGSSPISDTDIFTIFFVLYDDPSINTNYFTINLYKAGTYDNQNISAGITNVNETLIVLNTQSFSINLMISYKTDAGIFYCNQANCVINSFDNYQLNVTVTNTGSFEIFSIICVKPQVWNKHFQACGNPCSDSCEICNLNGDCCNTELYYDYTWKKGNYSILEAVESFSKDPNADLCLLGLMWSDLISVNKNFESDDYFCVLNNQAVNLLGTNHFHVLTTELVDEIYGYSWKNVTKIINPPTEACIQPILDQSSLYLSYYNLSSDSFNNVSSKLAEFYSYYSEQTLSLDSSPITGKSSEDLLPVLQVYKEKIKESDLVYHNFSVGTSNISFNGFSPFESSQIVSIFFVLYSDFHLASDYFSINLYSAGTYDSAYPHDALNDAEVEMKLIHNSFTINVNLTYYQQPNAQFICSQSSCEIVSFSNFELALETQTTGMFEIFSYNCSEGSLWNPSDKVCYVCPSRCLSCSADNKCSSCSPQYSLCGFSCFNCSQPCTNCSADNTCTSCADGYKLNGSSCYKCPSYCNSCSADNVCTSCPSGYILNGTTCYQCPSNCSACSANNTCTACNESSYSLYNGSCYQCNVSNCSYCSQKDYCGLCYANYSNINGSCLPCKRYISQANIVSAYYNSNFSSIYIDFNTNLTMFTGCSNLLTSLLNLGNSPYCYFYNSTQVIIKLGTNWTGLTGQLVLNGSNLLSSNLSFPCSATVPSLSTNVYHNSTISTPVPVITGYDTVYIACKTVPPGVYSAGNSIDNTGAGLAYSWNYSINSTTNPGLNSSFASQNSSTLVLDGATYLSDYLGYFNISVNTTNVFNESAVASFSIFLPDYKGLLVAMSGGNNSTIYNKENLVFTLNILYYCDFLGTPTYSWNLTRTNDTSLSPFLKTLSTTNKLYIAKNALKPYYYYNFTGTATLNGVSGSDYIVLYVKPYPLIVYISCPLQINPSYDLVISASGSQDPNYVTSNLTYKWSCTVNKTPCSGSLASSFASFNTSTITVSKSLLSGLSVLNVTLKFSSSYYNYTQSGSQTVNITISSSSNLIVTLYPPKAKLPLSHDSNITSSVTIYGSQSGTFLWNVSNGVVVQPNNYPFLFLKAGSITKGGNYYTFSLLVNQGVAYTVSLTLKSNIAAYCSYANIDGNTGYALSTVFTITSSCYDGDEEDYPLYSYSGYYYQNLRVYTNSRGSPTGGTLQLLSGNSTAFYSVCDTYNDCFYANFSMVISLNPSLDYKTRYFYDIMNPDKISQDIIAITNSYAVTNDFLNTMYLNITSYEQTQPLKDFVLIERIVNSFSGLINSLQIPNLNSTFAEKCYSYIKNMLNTYDIYLEDNTMLSILMFTEQLTNFNASDPTLLNYSNDLWKLALNHYFISKFPQFECSFNLTGKSSTKKKTFNNSDYLNKPISFNGITLSIPNLNLPSTSLLNVLVARFVGLNNNSDVIEIGFSTSGTYADYTYQEAEEVPVTSFSPSLKVKVDSYNKTSKYSVGYYDSKTQEYSTKGCDIVNVTYSEQDKKQYAWFETSHASLFSLLDFIYTCGYDYSPFIILVVVFFIEIFILPYALLLDSMTLQKETGSISSDLGLTKTIDNSPSSPASITERPLTSMSYSAPDLEEFSNSSIENPEAADYTIEFELKPLENLEKKIQTTPKPKWASIIEGHLLFGLIIYRPVFNRPLRVITLFTVLILQLLLEGLLIKGFEDYNTGVEMSTQTLFDEYAANYFGYTIFAIVIAFPVEMFLMAVFSHKKENNPGLYATGLTLALFCTIGSFIGVFILTFKFCFQWSGYWAVSFLWSILIEIFILQFIYMTVRYLVFKEKEQA